MAEPALNSPGVVPLVGKSVAAGVAQHVRVGLQLQAGTGGSPLDHSGEAGRGERRPAVADEDEGRRRTFALEPAQIGQSKTMGGTTIFRAPRHAAQGIGLGSPLRRARADGTTPYSRSDGAIRDSDEDELTMVIARAIQASAHPGRRECNRVSRNERIARAR
jgi:hypothetical protein